MRTILVVDVQGDFVTGSLAVPGAYDAVSLINRELERGIGGERLIIASRDEHVDPGDHWDPARGGYIKHCEKDTPGADYAVGFHRELVDIEVTKGAHAADPSPFDGHAPDGRSLEEILVNAGATVVEICGIATDVCVEAAVMDALKLGFQPILLVSLTAAIGGNEGKTAAVKRMIDAGAWVK